MEYEKNKLLCMRYLINEIKNPLIFSGVTVSSNILLASFNEGNILLPINALSCFSLGYLVSSLLVLKNKYFKYKQELIASDSGYVKANYLYQQLQIEFVNLINKFEVEDILEIYYFYLISLKMGVLSYNGRFEYSDDVAENGELVKLLGAKVASGHGNFCHVNAFLNDLYNGLGKESFSVLGVSFDECNQNCKTYVSMINKLLKKEKIDWHTITLVGDEKGKIYLDPFNRDFSVVEEGKFIQMNDRTILRDFIYSFKDLWAIDQDEKYKELLKREIIQTNRGEMCRIYNKMYDYIFKYFKEFIEFNAEHKELLYELASCYDKTAGFDKLTLKL